VDLPDDAQLLLARPGGGIQAYDGQASCLPFCDDCTLYIKRPDGRYRLFVRTLLGKVFAVGVHPCDTIASLKAMIHLRVPNCPPDRQSLVFNPASAAGGPLEDSKTLLDYSIPERRVNESQNCPNYIYLIPRPTLRPAAGTARIVVKAAGRNGKTISAIHVELSDAIEDIKTRIHDEQGISPDRQHLRFAGTEILEDGRSLNDYGIRSESTLWMDVSLESSAHAHAHARIARLRRQLQ